MNDRAEVRRLMKQAEKRRKRSENQRKQDDVILTRACMTVPGLYDVVDRRISATSVEAFEMMVGVALSVLEREPFSFDDVWLREFTECARDVIQTDTRTAQEIVDDIQARTDIRFQLIETGCEDSTCDDIGGIMGHYAKQVR